MRKIRDVLRHKFEHQLSDRKIARSCKLSRSTVKDYLIRFQTSDLPWPLPDAIDETTIEQRLFPPSSEALKQQQQLPNWSQIHKDLRRQGMTLALVWQEYKAADPAGYQYSWFCDKYREWRQHLNVVMRQHHVAGEKLFLDYAGQTMPVTDTHTGEVTRVQIFVATLGASSYTYCEATLSQSLPDWIGSHVRAFAFFGGLPNILVPDNLKSAVSTPHLYEPGNNLTYQEMAEYYHVAVVPARVRKPQDKGKVESAVQIVERWILARLRDCTFFTLQALNDAIKPLLAEMNGRPFQKMPDSSRQSLFVSLDKPALKPLPATPYEFAEWKDATVHIDYHIDIERHYYSVPFVLARKRLSVRITSQIIECFHRGERVASHRRSRIRGGFSTDKAHMPESHRQYAEWTPERLQNWAGKTGSSTQAVIEHILASRKHPEQTFRSCLGIMRLGKSYTPERLEQACRRALHLETFSYRSLESILKKNLDQQPLPESTPGVPLPDQHENLRGPEYFKTRSIEHHGMTVSNTQGDEEPC